MPIHRKYEDAIFEPVAELGVIRHSRPEVLVSQLEEPEPRLEQSPALEGEALLHRSEVKGVDEDVLEAAMREGEGREKATGAVAQLEPRLETKRKGEGRDRHGKDGRGQDRDSRLLG